MSVKLSVIIVSRNRSAYLSLAINSILQGSVRPDELIIVDNASDDSTAEIVKMFIAQHPEFKIKYLFESKIGISYARNTGIQQAEHNIVAFTDDDCVVRADWIANIKAAHHDSPYATAIGGKTCCANNNLLSLTLHAYRVWLTIVDMYPQTRNMTELEQAMNSKHLMISLSTQNISYNKSLLPADIPLFNPKLPPAEAVDLSWRIFKANSAGIIYDPNIVVYHKYPSRIYSLIKTAINYGEACRHVIAHARKYHYLPPQVHPPGIKSLWHYLVFSFFYTRSFLFSGYRKTLLFLLLLFREIIFLSGHFIFARLKPPPDLPPASVSHCKADL